MPKNKSKVKVNKEDTLCKKIKDLAEDAISYTTDWAGNQQNWFKMRYRIKKEKNFPFAGCSNLRMPTIEIKLRKVKSARVNDVFGIRPIVQVVPAPGGNYQTALKIEKFLDHLIMDVMDVKPKAVIGIDQACEKGFFVFKPYWRTDIVPRVEKLELNDLPPEEAMWLLDPARTSEEITEAVIKKFDIDMSPLVRKDNLTAVGNAYKQIMDGKSNVEITVQDVLYNAPDVALCDPERVYVPTDSGYHPKSCSWIIHEFFMPIETVRANGKIKGWSIGDIAEIDEVTKNNVIAKSGESKDKDIDSLKDLREGIECLDRTGKIRIWEFYGWEDINDDGVDEKCVITLAPDFDKELRKISLPFYSGEFPFVKLPYELTDDRWFSHRGIPEIIEDIVKEIDMQHNQKLDQQTMRNTPMYLYRAGMINKNAMQFTWGQGIAIQGMQSLADVIAPLNNSNSNVEFSYEREQMILETKIEELIGQPDFSLQSMINKRQPRTLGEVQLQFQNLQQVSSLESDLFRSAFTELFNWVWELWCQYGDDDYEFAYFGKDGWERIRLTKEEVQGKYKVTVRGNDQNTNPQLRIQKAQMILQGMQNPVAIQTGVVTPVNIAQAYRRFYQALDVDGWEELVSMPQPPPPQPLATLIKPKFKDLTDAEQAQVLAQSGLQPDVQGRALKSQATIQEKQVEQNKSEIENAKMMQEMMMAGGSNDGYEGENGDYIG